MSEQKINRIVISPNYETLVSLVGGDEPAIVELRRGIAETFTRNYLKAFLHDSALQEITAVLDTAVKKEVAVQVKQRIGEMSGGGYSNPKVFVLTAAMQSAISQQIETQVTDYLRKEVAEKTAEIKTRIDSHLARVEQDLKRIITNKANAIQAEAVEAEVARRLNAVLEAVASRDNGRNPNAA